MSPTMSERPRMRLSPMILVHIVLGLCGWALLGWMVLTIIKASSQATPEHTNSSPEHTTHPHADTPPSVLYYGPPRDTSGRMLCCQSNPLF